VNHPDQIIAQCISQALREGVVIPSRSSTGDIVLVLAELHEGGRVTYTPVARIIPPLVPLEAAA
jgi:hypothetical protein